MKSAFYGGLGGFLGQAAASPFFMVRNQMQSAGVVNKTAVGHQHNHQSMSSALMNIYRAHGLKGLYRGVLVTIPRGMLGSSAQIGTFGFTKDFLQRNSSLDQTSISFISGCIAGTGRFYWPYKKLLITKVFQ